MGLCVWAVENHVDGRSRCVSVFCVRERREITLVGVPGCPSVNFAKNHDCGHSRCVCARVWFVLSVCLLDLSRLVCRGMLLLCSGAWGGPSHFWETQCGCAMSIFHVCGGEGMCGRCGWGMLLLCSGAWGGPCHFWETECGCAMPFFTLGGL